MPTVAELEARLRVESAQFTKGLGDAQKSVSEFKREVTAAGDALKKDMAGASGAATESLAQLRREWDDRVSASLAAMKADARALAAETERVTTSTTAATAASGAWRGMAVALAASLSLVTAGAGAVLAGTSLVTSAMTEQLQRSRDLQAATGLQAQQAVALGNTFQALGLEGGVLSAAMGRIRQELEKGGDLLRFMGLSARDASGHLKAEGDTLLEVHGRVQLYASATERAQAVTDAFGTELGRRLAPFFDLSRERLTALLAKMGALAPQTEENRRATESYLESTTKLGIAWEALKTRYGPPVLDTLSAIIAKLIDVTRRSDEARESMRKLPPPTSEIGTAPGDARVRALMRGETTNAGAAVATDLDRVDAALSRIATRLSELSPGQQLAIQKIRQELDLIAKTPADAAIARLKAQFDAIADPRIQAAVRANYDAAFSAILAKEAEAQLKATAAAFKPLESALATLQSNVAALDLSPTEAEFRRLVQPVEQAIAALERSGQISPTVAAEYRTAAAAAAQLAIDHRLANEEVKKFVALLNSDITSKLQGIAQGWDDEADANRRAAETLATWSAGMDVAMGAADSGADAFDRLAAQAKEGLVKDLGAAERELAALKATLGQTGPEADVLRAFLAKTGFTVADLDERTKNFLVSLGKVKAEFSAAASREAFEQRLASIGREARLVGSDLDRASAEAAEFKRRILELQAIKNPTGEIQAEIDELRVKFADTTRFITYRDALTDVFRAPLDALQTLVQGVILGTTTIGDAIKRLGQSIVIDFVNKIIQGALGPLAKALGAVMAALFTGGDLSKAWTEAIGGGSGGGNLISSIIGGAVKIFDWFSSGSSAVVGFANGIDELTGGISVLTNTATGASSWLSNLTGSVRDLLPVIGNVIGLGTSIYGLVTGIQSGNPLQIGLGVAGTALSGYGLAASAGLVTPLSTLLMNALHSVAPQLASQISQMIGQTVGTSLVSQAPTIATSLGLLFNPATIFAAMFGLGAIAGQQDDAEQAAADARMWAAEARAALSAITRVTAIFDDTADALATTDLPATLEAVRYAIRSFPDLVHSAFFGAESILAVLPEMRAKVGAVFLAALDAATAAGIDTAATTASPVQFRTSGTLLNAVTIANSGGTDLAGPINLAYLRDAMEGLSRTGRGLDVLGGEIGETASLLRHLIEANDDASRALAGAWAAKIDSGDQMPFTRDDMNELFREVMTPERLAQISAHGDIGDIGNFLIETSKLNARLNQEFLTIQLRNAVVDIAGTLGLGEGQVGLGSGGQWRLASSMNPDGSTNWDTLPSASAIAEVAERLRAAGFEAGHYGEALQAYLLAIDANLVNHPAWAGIVAALDGQGGASVAAIQQAASQAAVDAAQALVTRLRGEIDAAIAATDWGLAAQLTAAWQQAQQALIAAQASLADALRPASPTEFYEAAKAITDNLTAQIKHQLEVRAGTTDENTLKNIDVVIERMTAQVQAWSGLVQLYAALPVEMANLTGSLSERTAAAIEAFRVQRQTLVDTITAARTAADEALATGDIVAIQAAEQQLHDAVIARYQFELDALAKLEAEQARLAEARTAVTRTLVDLAVSDMRAPVPDVAAFNALYETFVNMARLAPTAAEQLRGIAQGLGLVIAAAPASASFFANGSSIYGPVDPLSLAPGSSAVVAAPTSIPALIWGTLVQQAAPFMDQLSTLIGDALTGGDLEGALALLKEEAGAIQQVAAAGIAAVNAWMETALADLAEEAKGKRDDIEANYQALEDFIRATASETRARIEAERDAKLAANRAIIDGNNLTIEGNNLRIKGLRAEAAAVQEALQIAQQWRQAVATSQDFTRSLLLGAGSPLDRDAQLALVRADYDAALQAYRSGPTAEGLGEIQRAAQARLQLEGQYLGTASADYSASVSGILGDLEQARAMAPTDTVDALQAQIDGINQQVASLESANEALVKANQELADLNEKIKADAQVQLDWWTAWERDKLDEAAKNKQRDLDLVEEWRKKQEEAIRNTAADQIETIRQGTAAALRENARLQFEILDQLDQAQQDAIRAIIGDAGSIEEFKLNAAKETNRLLGLIQQDIHALLPQAATGMAYVPRDMPVYVHEGERILTRDEREAYEAAEPIAPGPPPYRAPRRRRAARGLGHDEGQLAVIPELPVEINIDGERIATAVIKNIKVRVRRGDRQLIPEDAVYTVSRG